jgi:hypothetical protein
MLNAGMQPFIVYSGAALALIAQGFVFGRAFADRLWRRYRCFLALAAVSGMYNVSTLVDHPLTYRQYWLETRWPTVLLQAAAVIEAFWILADHFRGMHHFARRLLGTILGISALAAALAGLQKTEYQNLIRGAVLVDQYVSLWLVLTAIFCAIFFRQFAEYPIRPNAIRHLKVLTFLFGMNFIGNTLLLFSHPHNDPLRTATFVIFAIISPIAYAWWAWVMNRDGEVLPFQPPTMSGDDYDNTEGGHKRAARELKRAASKAFKKTSGS